MDIPSSSTGVMKPLSHDGSHGGSGKAEVEHVECREVAKPTTLWHKIKRHYARWWWAHIMAFCIVFLIIVLCVVYVAMPKIAQKSVDASTFTFTALDFLDPTPESLTITIAAVQYSSSIFTPTLDAFNVSMHLVTNGTTGTNAITQIAMPRIHAHHPNTNISIDNQKVPILDYDQVTAFATQIINQDNVTVRMEGKTKLHEGALPVIGINYNSSITFQGLNGLPGFDITNTTVNLKAGLGEPNMVGFATIPNPTVLTVELGNVTLSISTAQEGIIGNSTVNDFTLRPGMNLLPMSAVVNSSAVAASMDTQGMVDLIIVGETAVYNGVHLTYYEKTLQSHVLHKQLNLTAIIASSL